MLPCSPSKRRRRAARRARGDVQSIDVDLDEDEVLLPRLRRRLFAAAERGGRAAAAPSKEMRSCRDAISN